MPAEKIGLPRVGADHLDAGVAGVIGDGFSPDAPIGGAGDESRPQRVTAEVPGAPAFEAAAFFTMSATAHPGSEPFTAPWRVIERKTLPDSISAAASHASAAETVHIASGCRGGSRSSRWLERPLVLCLGLGITPRKKLRVQLQGFPSRAPTASRAEFFCGGVF